MDFSTSDRIVKLLQDIAFELEDLKEPFYHILALAAVAGQSKEDIDFRRMYRAKDILKSQESSERAELAIVKALILAGEFNKAYKRLNEISRFSDRSLCIIIKGLAALFKATNDEKYLNEARLAAEGMNGIFGQLYRARAWLSVFQASYSFDDLKRAYEEAKNIAYLSDQKDMFIEIINTLF